MIFGTLGCCQSSDCCTTENITANAFPVPALSTEMSSYKCNLIEDSVNDQTCNETFGTARNGQLIAVPLQYREYNVTFSEGIVGLSVEASGGVAIVSIVNNGGAA